MWSVHLASKVVEQELLDLPPEMQARLLRISELISCHGLHNVGLPYVRHIQEELWEIRLAGRERIGRGLYVTMSGKRVVVLRFFIKKTQKTPRKEIQTAMERLRCLKNETIRELKGKASGESGSKS